MTTKIEDIYDAIKTIIATELPTRFRIPNPYFVEGNSDLILTNGFGIRIDAGRNTNRVISCQATWERLFTIILTTQITATENNFDARELLEKSILIDHDKLLRAVESNPTLNGVGMKANIADDGGIQLFVTADRAKFLEIDISLYVEYLEQLP